MAERPTAGLHMPGFRAMLGLQGMWVRQVTPGSQDAQASQDLDPSPDALQLPGLAVALRDRVSPGLRYRCAPVSDSRNAVRRTVPLTNLESATVAAAGMAAMVVAGIMITTAGVVDGMAAPMLMATRDGRRTGIPIHT